MNCIDLSNIYYLDSKQVFCGVGWLDGASSYNKGVISEDVRYKLSWLSANIFVPMGGRHKCALCQKQEHQVHVGGVRRVLGSDVIVVPGIKTFGGQPLYLAPNLIYHYCCDHQYLPPDEFLHAINSLDLKTFSAKKISMLYFQKDTMWQKLSDDEGLVPKTR